MRMDEARDDVYQSSSERPVRFERHKNWWVVVGIILLIAAGLAAGWLLPRTAPLGSGPPITNDNRTTQPQNQPSRSSKT